MAVLKVKENSEWKEIQAIKGSDGHTPVKGVDYFTPEDIASLNIPTKTSDLINDEGFTSNEGTITGITMNGENKGTSGVVDLGTVITSHQDISGKVDKVPDKGLSENDFTDEDKANLNNNTAARHTHTNKSVLDTINGFKTINNQSILGSGNIEIQGGAVSYPDLTNKPKINDVELVDNKTSEELGLQPKGDYAMKETTDSIRADLGSNFGEIQEDLYYKLVNNKETGRFDGTVGSKLSNISASSFTRFRIPVEENEFYTIKYRSYSADIKFIYIVDENDIVIQVVDNDIEYTSISMNEISCLIPKNAKYLCISTYCTSNNFNNNPREYTGLKTIKKEVVKNMVDSLYGKTGKFKTLDLSDYPQNASTGGLNPLSDLTEDGVYQVRGMGYINFGNEIYDYAPGDIIFRNYDGEVVSFIAGTYGAGFFSYDPSEEAYTGGYYTSISDVIYEIERLAKKTMNAVNSVLANQTVSPNYEYRRLSDTGSTAIRITLGAALKNLTIADREEFSLLFKTHATTPCTWTWYTSTVPVKYHGDSVVDGKFVPELNTWYKIDARWEGKFWLLNIIGVKGD